MASTTVPGMLSWGNLSVPYEPPSDQLRCIAGAFPFFPRLVQRDCPVKSRFLDSRYNDYCAYCLLVLFVSPHNNYLCNTCYGYCGVQYYALALDVYPCLENSSKEFHSTLLPRPP
jgi:hypothetical protein